MMWKTKTYAQASALPAIAAALALSSTPAWSQEVTPPANAPEPAVSAPPPTVDSAPVTLDTTVTAPPAVEQTTTDPVEPAAAKAAPTPAKAKRTPVAKKPSTARAPAPAAAETAATAAAPGTASVAPVPAPQPMVEARPPVTDQVAAVPPPMEQKSPVDEDAMMLGGGALALLALGGAAVAVTRRRREDDEIVEEATMDDSMIAPGPGPATHDQAVFEEQPAIVAPSAFAWSQPQQADPYVDRRQGETWVERAHRGPTPDNPSLSLRKRLKRAAFFDAREKRIATGEAQPVPTDAGLPASANERVLELA